MRVLFSFCVTLENIFNNAKIELDNPSPVETRLQTGARVSYAWHSTAMQMAVFAGSYAWAYTARSRRLLS